jgi:hypothetical protein
LFVLDIQIKFMPFGTRSTIIQEYPEFQGDLAEQQKKVLQKAAEKKKRLRQHKTGEVVEAECSAETSVILPTAVISVIQLEQVKNPFGRGRTLERSPSVIRKSEPKVKSAKRAHLLDVSGTASELPGPLDLSQTTSEGETIAKENEDSSGELLLLKGQNIRIMSGTGDKSDAMMTMLQKMQDDAKAAADDAKAAAEDQARVAEETKQAVETAHNKVSQEFVAVKATLAETQKEVAAMAKRIRDLEMKPTGDQSQQSAGTANRNSTPGSRATAHEQRYLEVLDKLIDKNTTALDQYKSIDNPRSE